MVIGISGYTHGVRLSASPRTKIASSVSGSPRSANVPPMLLEKRLAFLGAALRGVKEDEGAGVRGGVGVTEGATANSTSAFFGGRHTLSLHDWWCSVALFVLAFGFSFAVNGI